MKKYLVALFYSVALLLPSIVKANRVEIPFWHSLAGSLGQTLEILCNDFNHRQKRYKIIPIYKGSYPETLTSFVAAFRAGEAPPLIQIYEIATATMLNPPGVIKPLYRLMEQFPQPNFTSQKFLMSLRKYYGDKEGQLYAMPFNSSSAVLYYNKSLFDKAGIAKVPETWPEVETFSKILLKKDLANCGVTSAYPSWINIESFVQWHGDSLVKTSSKHHLLGGEEISYQLEALKYHLKKLKEWHQQSLYQYAGRESNATALFTSGHCAMLLQSSGSFSSLKMLAPFTVDVSYMPYWPQYKTKQTNAAIGGAALWVISGHSNNVYRGITEFLAYLSSKKIQTKWQLASGYFPVIRAPLIPDNNSNLKASKIAYQQVSNLATDLSPGERLGYYAQIRLFNDEQIEAILSGLLTVEQALLRAERYANKLLSKFKKTMTHC